MKQQWFEQQRSAARHQTDHFAGLLMPRSNGVRIQLTVPVRSGNSAQRPVGLSAFIELQSNGQCGIQNGCRRFDVKDACLFRPASEARDVDFLPNRNVKILMPWHFPVGVWNLVEKYCLNRKATGAEDGLCQSANLRTVAKSAKRRRFVKQIANCIDFAAPACGIATACFMKRRD